MTVKHECNASINGTYPVKSIISTSPSDEGGPTVLEKPLNGDGVVRRDLLDSRPICRLVDSKFRFRFRSASEAGLPSPSSKTGGFLGVSITADGRCDLEAPAGAGVLARL